MPKMKPAPKPLSRDEAFEAFRNSDMPRKILESLLRDRLENYGYDRTSWRRIQAQRCRAKQALRPYLGCPLSLHWESCSSRLNLQTGEYVVGQSSNEEITNVLRRLVNPEAPCVC